jgi:branched-chain amino acid aminotransferase/4-amino-4-deoxychorismate lyase
MFLVYNGTLITETSFTLSTNDRAFQYGDGFFETIRYEQQRLQNWPDHTDRIQEGLSALHLTFPDSVSIDTLPQLIDQLLTANQLQLQTARIKVQIWRQPGGLYTPTTHQANVLISARLGQPFTLSQRTKVGIFDAVRLSSSPVSGIKTLNALPYVLAGLAKLENQSDDMILLDQSGHLAECIASNLFWFSGNQLITPSLATGCINGITRRRLLRAFPDAQEGLFTSDDLVSADAVFAANVAGLQFFTQWGSPERIQYWTSILERLLNQPEA